MNQPLSRTQLGDGIHFTHIPDSKFKHNRISVHCMVPLQKETVSDNAMVPLMLTRGSRNLPDFSALNVHLNRLYGANLGGGSARFNQYQRVYLSLSSLDNPYAMKGEDLVGESAKLVADLFLNPNFDDAGAFMEKDFALERQFLIDSIEAEINDKRSYAINRMTETMFEGEVFSVPQYGTMESAKATTPKSAADAWRKLLDTAVIEILFVGPGDPISAKEAFEEAFKARKRTPITLEIQQVGDTAGALKALEEPMEGIQQGKLVMGFRCKRLVTQDQQNVGRVFSALFGGTPFSKLFLNVRERLSLCYYCAARVDSLNGYLMVDSGVEAANKAKTQAEILAQLEAVQRGEITPEELTNTKLLLANAIENTGDSLFGLESWYLGQILQGRNTTPEEDKANIEKVTTEQIVTLAKEIVLDTVYFLTGKEGQNEQE